MESFGEFPSNQAVTLNNDTKSKTNTATKESSDSKPTKTKPASPLEKSITLSKIPTESNDANNPISPTDYPQLSNNPLEPFSEAGVERDDDEDDEADLDISKSFQRPSSPSPATTRRNKAAVVSKVGEDGVVRMHKFTLYETLNYYYILGSDLLDASFRILKIDRTADVGELSIIEDDIVYNRRETHQILNAIDEGNRSTGGLKLKISFWGILGFIRFTSHYYMIYVTKRSQVAMVGGHYIYQIDKTEMLPLITNAATKVKTDKQLEECRFVNILNNLDLSRSFYFSYSYDVTHTLQHNIMREREALQEGLPAPVRQDHNDMFVWNNHLLGPAKVALRNPFDWCLAVIHGYVDQSALSVYWGRVVYITIIARRSRFFAGARYLKRGANDLGYVANDVETEQIVSEMLTTSFHSPGPILFANPNYTSYVQHRGSIPLHWTQDSTGVTPKPDIHLNVVDPFFSAAALHFDNLFQRYGTPIYVLNLIKARERTPRESKLLKEYTLAINYLNQFLPEDKQILYHAWDMSRASKSRDQDVIGSLEAIAEDILPKTSFFQNGNDPESGLKLQSGVARTNCVDCLDRTNAAQFVIAKKALGYQLQALGVIEDTSVEYDSDAINLFTHMWHDHGDTIAVQYGGSHLVNTMATYRKINQWTSHSRDMVESFKRYYTNSFMDAQRQEAYNLFLGNYVFAHDKPMLWDLSTDYYLHHSDPRSMFGKRRPSYRQWYTEQYLEPPKIPPSIWPRELREEPLRYFDDYWVEYYRPLLLSSFKKMYSFKMHSNLRYIPITSTSSGKYDLSPFRVRTGHESDSADVKHKNKSQPSKRKGVKIIAPSDDVSPSPDPTSGVASIDALLADSVNSKDGVSRPPKPGTLGPWLDAQKNFQTLRSSNKAGMGIIKKPSLEMFSSVLPGIKNPVTNPVGTKISPLEVLTGPSGVSVTSPPPVSDKASTKADLALQAFTAMIANSLDPRVSEQTEYERYVTHPCSIPLVVSSDIDYASVDKDFLEYLAKTAEDPLALYNAGAGHGVDHHHHRHHQGGHHRDHHHHTTEFDDPKSHKSTSQTSRGRPRMHDHTPTATGSTTSATTNSTKPTKIAIPPLTTTTFSTSLSNSLPRTPTFLNFSRPEFPASTFPIPTTTTTTPSHPPLTTTTRNPPDQILNNNNPQIGFTTLTLDERAETSLDDYVEFVNSGLKEDPLTVGEEDGDQKRYKAYRQWLRGKSLFKQKPVVGGEVI